MLGITCSSPPLAGAGWGGFVRPVFPLRVEGIMTLVAATGERCIEKTIPRTSRTRPGPSRHSRPARTSRRPAALSLAIRPHNRYPGRVNSRRDGGDSRTHSSVNLRANARRARAGGGGREIARGGAPPEEAPAGPDDGSIFEFQRSYDPSLVPVKL